LAKLKIFFRQNSAAKIESSQISYPHSSMGGGGGVPAYVSNRHPQFSFFVELAGGDDAKVLVEQRSHKTSLFGIADLS
jgi:hypothetical protein